MNRYVASSASAKTALNVKWRARNLFYAKNLIRLQTNVKALTLEKGDIVYNEGDVGNAMYLVNEGKPLFSLALSVQEYSGFRFQLQRSTAIYHSVLITFSNLISCVHQESFRQNMTEYAFIHMLKAIPLENLHYCF
jgi:hypothetical protein